MENVLIALIATIVPVATLILQRHAGSPPRPAGMVAPDLDGA